MLGADHLIFLEEGGGDIFVRKKYSWEFLALHKKNAGSAIGEKWCSARETKFSDQVQKG